MTPIHDLLNRIRWDKDFGRGNFTLGYFDRVQNRVIMVPFQELDFSQNERQGFRILDAEGRFQRIPFHRVREIYKDGQCIWRR